MNAPVSPIILLDAVRRERDKRNAERSLIEFTRQCWSIIEPGTQFVDNWHLHAIADHLEALSNGEIQNLLINIPPGCCKSILVSVAFPAWEWTKNPELRYLGASYGSDLAIRDAAKCRDIIMSPWYQERWPQVCVRKGSDQKTKYELTSGGWRMATSVGGRATGEHPDRKIVDDPHSAAQADSDTERNSGLVWFDRTLSTRGESRKARTVVVKQRLHENDLSGHILADSTSDYVHLCLPMEYDGQRHKTKIGWEDPRTMRGSLLWPEMFPAESVKRLKKRLGSYGAAGQLQQRPAPEGGGILKTAHFQTWPKGRPLPVFDFVIQSYDTAFSGEDAKQNAQTAHQTWGLATYKEKRIALLLDAWAEHLGYPELRKRVIKDWKTVYGTAADDKTRKGRRPDTILVEKKASGHSLLQDLRAANVPALSYSPTADKIARAHQAAPILELDCLYIPESTQEPGTFVTWARPLVEHCEKFPTSELKDNVDAFTQFVIWARDSDYFDLDFVEIEDPEEVDYHAQKKRKQNPYAA